MDSSADVPVDKRFNRYVLPRGHVYMNNTGDRLPWRTELYDGWIKCKLVHGVGYSLVVPDVVAIPIDDGLGFIQPLFFMPNLLMKDGDHVDCGLYIDIACSQTLAIHFHTGDFITDYPDGSELYRCKIRGPDALSEYATGSCRIDGSNRLLLRLFHHTTSESRESILKSGHFRLSHWNIAGTKKVTNVGYVYLTSLPEIVCDNDLKQIAMASDGDMHFLIDGFPVPPVHTPKMLEALKDKILTLKVYRESTLNRRSTIGLDVDAAYLASSHFLRHRDERGTHYYEIVNPYAHRLALKPGEVWNFDPTAEEGDYSNCIHFRYVVVGDGSHVEGLAAPFDEEDTKEIATIADIPDGRNILRHWFDTANSVQFEGDSVFKVLFEPEAE